MPTQQPYSGTPPYLSVPEHAPQSDTALALHAIADRLDTSPPGAFSASVWPLSTACSAIARLGAVADRIRERADAGEADDRDRACLDAELEALLSAIENMEAYA